MGSLNVTLEVEYGSEKVCDVVVTLTYHVPEARPLCVNVIPKVTSWNDIESATLAPFTVKEPE